MARYSDLWDVVDSVKKDLEIATDAHNLTFYKYAQDEFRELILAGLHDAFTFKTVKLDVVDGVATLPPDYQTWLKVGYERCGHIMYFSYNADILNLPKTCCSDDEFNDCCNQFDSGGVNSPYWGDFWMYSSYFHNNQITAGAFGATANINYGDFKIDIEKNQVVLGRHSRRHKHIILQYRSTGYYGIDGVVNDDIIQALVDGVHWRRVRFRAETADPGLRPMVAGYRRERTVSWGRVLARKAAFTKESFLEVYRAGVTMIPKR